MMRAEILAPAGGMDSLVAAVRCGADAVYFGGKTLNARRNAGNFDDGELQKAIEYCHARGVRAYLTLNTLVYDGELPLAVKFIERACTIGADALILQDLGLSSLARELCDIPLHASTQMSVLSVHGIGVLEKLGFCRAVLPRELSRREMGDILRATSLETEVFVHGALCMCVSGQCEMSAALGSRSGNRGLCAQPCRLPFAARSGTGHDLSLKDLSLLAYLGEMQKAGVSSFKIEGRMKRPEYVAACVTACRMALEGEAHEDILRALHDVFSRSGFTDGYYTGKTGKDMFGVRTKKDVDAAAESLPELARLYEHERQSQPVRFSLECAENTAVSLTAECGGKRAAVLGCKVQKAESRSLTHESAAQQISKCGGTQFFAQSVETEIEQGLFVPMSELNDLRRRALCELEGELIKREPYIVQPLAQDRLNAGAPHKAAHQRLIAFFSDVSQIPKDISSLSQVILPLRSSTEDFLHYDAAVMVPRAIFGAGDSTVKKLTRLRAAGVKCAVCGTLDAVAIARELGFEVTAGLGTNLFNTRSLEVIEKLGATRCVLSPELSLKKSCVLGGDMQRGVTAYGNMPLMLVRNCPNANGIACRDCGGRGMLTDRLGEKFPVTCVNGCPEVLNSRAVYMADKKAELAPFDFLLLYFTVETREECEAVLDAYDRGLTPEGSFTRGLFYRGVE